MSSTVSCDSSFKKPPIPQKLTTLGTRPERVNLERFPYHFLFRIVRNQVRVLVVGHDSETTIAGPSSAMNLISCDMKQEATFHLNFTIRRGQVEDAGLLAELGARTFSETFAPDNSDEDMAAYLADAFSPRQQAAELADPRAMFLIAEAGETNKVTVGYAMIRSGDVPREVTGDKPIELVRLYVTGESIGSGVGAALMQACIDEAKQQGYKTLWLGVWENNFRAQGFYLKWNFHQVGTHVFQLGDDPQTDILMQRCISE
jgi:ribosomal protein S18 acetylase RimI-like enzyme